MNEEAPDFNLNKLDISKKTFVNSLVTVGISFIPKVGPFLAEGFNHYGKVRQERLNLFLEKLKEYFDGLSDEEIEPEFLKSEDFAWLFEAVLKKVAETKSENKRETFRKILMSSIGAKKVSDFSETFLNLTSQLHEKQIEILSAYHETILEYNEMSKKIYEFNEQNTQFLDQIALEGLKGVSADRRKAIDLRNEMLEKRKLIISKINQPAYFSIGKVEFDFYMQDLASKCLMKDITGSGMSDSNSLNYNVTLLGEQYLNFLKI